MENERYGLAGGVYPASRFSAERVAQGFFGGFVLQEDGSVQAVPGIVMDIDRDNPSVQRLDSIFVTPEPDLKAEETTDIVGPDIAGDDWEGWFWMQDSQGNRYLLTPVTAVVTHVGSEVTITMNFSPPIIIGDYYWDSMDSVGNMHVYDEYYETWTTYFGPATETSLTIADFVGNVDDPKADLYVFELKREPAPPPPPPEPEPADFLPAIYKILFK